MSTVLEAPANPAATQAPTVPANPNASILGRMVNTSPTEGRVLRKFRLLIGWHTQPDYSVAPDKERDAEKFAEWLMQQPSFIQKMDEERQWARFCRVGYVYPDKHYYHGANNLVESYDDLVEKFNKNGSHKFERISEEGPALFNNMSDGEILAEMARRGLTAPTDGVIPQPATPVAAQQQTVPQQNVPPQPTGPKQVTTMKDIDQMSMVDLRKLADEEEINVSSAKNAAEAAKIIKAALKIK